MEYRLIAGFNRRYSVTPDGVVYSMILRKEGVSDTPVRKLVETDNRGYKRVSLRRSSWKDRIEGKYVHRLVAETYIANPNGYEEVNHIDGDKSNNSVSNLEWCSRQANIDHAWLTGLSASSMNKGNGMTTYIGSNIKTGETIEIVGMEALRNAGFEPSNVIRVCNGERKTHKGFTWNKIKSSERAKG